MKRPSLPPPLLFSRRLTLFSRDADFYYNYYRVFLVSWGIQHAHDRPELERDLVYYVVSGYESAKKMVEIVRDEIAATGRLRYGMVRFHFVFLFQVGGADLGWMSRTRRSSM